MDAATCLSGAAGRGVMSRRLRGEASRSPGSTRRRRWSRSPRRRLAASGVTADVVLRDMRDFELGRRFGGAVCPVNTLAHLAPGELERTWNACDGTSRPDGRYLVQLDLRDRAEDASISCWNMTGADMSIRVPGRCRMSTWPAAARSTARIEILTGERAGEVVEVRGAAGIPSGKGRDDGGRYRRQRPRWAWDKRASGVSPAHEPPMP
jgi:hypothetical protein